jgi:hypothetical protein
MNMLKPYALVFIVGAGCIALNLMIIQFWSRRGSVKHVTRTIQKTEDDEPYFHLQVPFYIYEMPELNWANATVDGEDYKPPEPQSVGAE